MVTIIWLNFTHVFVNKSSLDKVCICVFANCHFYTVQFWGGAWRKCWQLQRQGHRTEWQIDCKLPFLLFSFGAEHDGSVGNCSAKDGRLIANCHFYTVQFRGGA
jgi:hypothetical protein